MSKYQDGWELLWGSSGLICSHMAMRQGIEGIMQLAMALGVDCVGVLWCRCELFVLVWTGVLDIPLCLIFYSCSVQLVPQSLYVDVN